MSHLSGAGLSTLGQLSYLMVFVLGAVAYHFCVKPNPDILDFSAQWLPVCADSDLAKLPKFLQDHVKQFLNDNELEQQPASAKYKWGA